MLSYLVHIVRTHSCVENIRSKRQRISGWLVAASVFCYTYSIVSSGPILYVCGVLYWCALLFMLPDIQGRSRTQMRYILLCSLPGILVSLYFQNLDPINKALHSSTGILTLLVVAGLFGLSSKRFRGSGEREYNIGARAVISTYANTHFIGSVINFAAVVILGDRLQKKKPIDITQATLLSRAFASAGFWSPFFVTMAVAGTYSPEFDFVSVLPYGATIAVIGFLYTIVEFKIKGHLKSFVGLSSSVSSLMLPIGVVIAIAALIFLFPETSIIDIVIISALGFGGLFFVVGRHSVTEYIQNRLPNHCNEIALFLSAGTLNASLLGLTKLLPGQNPLFALTPTLCVTFIAVSLALNLLGVHPLISIAFFVGIVDLSGEHQNMLAFTLFSAWAMCSALGPLSGQNIGIASRYNIDSFMIAKSNILYSFVLFASCSAFILFSL